MTTPKRQYITSDIYLIEESNRILSSLSKNLAAFEAYGYTNEQVSDLKNEVIGFSDSDVEIIEDELMVARESIQATEQKLLSMIEKIRLSSMLGFSKEEQLYFEAEQVCGKKSKGTALHVQSKQLLVLIEEHRDAFEHNGLQDTDIQQLHSSNTSLFDDLLMYERLKAQEKYTRILHIEQGNALYKAVMQISQVGKSVFHRKTEYKQFLFHKDFLSKQKARKTRKENQKLKIDEQAKQNHLNDDALG